MTAASVRVEAQLTAFIRSTADSSVFSSGGNTLNNGGTSLALNFVIATNVILSSALAEIDETTVTTTAGDVVVHADERVADRRAGAELEHQRGRGRRRHARLQLDRLEVAELPLQPARHDPRRPADRQRLRQRRCRRDDGAGAQLARPCAGEHRRQRAQRRDHPGRGLEQGGDDGRSSSRARRAWPSASRSRATWSTAAPPPRSTSPRATPPRRLRPSSRPATASRSGRGRSTSTPARARAGRRSTTQQIPTSCSSTPRSPPAARSASMPRTPPRSSRRSR